MNNCSPAKRIYKLVSKVNELSLGTGAPMHAAWFQVLGLDQSNSNDFGKLEQMLFPFFGDVRDDIDVVRATLDEKAVPPVLYDFALEAVRNTLTSAHFNADYESIRRGTFNPQVMTALGWCAYTMPDTESEPASDALNDLLSKIDSLESLVSTVDLPPALAKFIRSLVARMRLATKRYATGGAAAFVEAYADTAADVLKSPTLHAETKAAAQDPKAASVLTRVNEVLGAAGEVGGAIDKAVAGGGRIASFGAAIAGLLT
jgi:hypothetical protein